MNKKLSVQPLSLNNDTFDWMLVTQPDHDIKRKKKQTEIIARWGPLPISMVPRSEGILKSEMLILARTSKYVNTTSV